MAYTPPSMNQARSGAWHGSSVTDGRAAVDLSWMPAVTAIAAATTSVAPIVAICMSFT